MKRIKGSTNPDATPAARRRGIAKGKIVKAKSKITKQTPMDQLVTKLAEGIEQHRIDQAKAKVRQRLGDDRVMAVLEQEEQASALALELSRSDSVRDRTNLSTILEAKATALGIALVMIAGTDYEAFRSLLEQVMRTIGRTGIELIGEAQGARSARAATNAIEKAMKGDRS